MSKKRMLTLLSTAALSAVAAMSVPTSLVAAPNPERKASNSQKFINSAYIVRLSEMPVVAYDGSIKGYAATKPRAGQKIDPNNTAVVRYKAFLDSRHDAVLSTVGGGSKLYSYGYVFNGFAADLTPAQAAKLRATKGVVSVTKDEALELDTSSTPGFLGLSGPGGFWETTGAKGENVIIGIVDGGAWPEHPSFSDRTGSNGNDTKDGKLGYQQIPGWNGRCVPGEAFTASNCNQKLIGARYYNAGWGGNAGIDATLPWEYNSPRDFGGHGTHTATTAGGNEGVTVTGPAAAFGKISGIAPRARIAAYKVCWETGAGGSCFNSDSVAAIDQAVADGVDVINFSISGSRTNFLDPVEVAFLYAASAGVFVATSAGNSGPTASTVAHPGPWLTTVAAGTHNRTLVGSATLASVTYTGASAASAAVTAPVIDSTAAALPGADPTKVALCYSSADGGNVLDPAKVNGKIVVCDRGVTARVNKSLAVAEAGGVGMILVNPSNNSLNADFHSVPTVHLQSTDRDAVKAFAATAGVGTINKSVADLNTPAPFTASFSSRGPLLAGNGDVLKPDVIAPGQDILAGVTPPWNQGRLFDLYSGTSMSSPHVAGLAALFKERYPSWTPMMIKSALMTTAYDVLDNLNPPTSTNPTRIFRQGAGHVSPNAALDPGLVYKAGWNDWLAFICGTNPGAVSTATCDTLKSMGYSTDPSDLNQASIAIGDMLVDQVVTRRVTNVGGSTATYNATVTGMAGFNVQVTPSSLVLKSGETKPYTVSFVRTDSSLNAFTGGQLTWTDGTHTVRSPIVVRPLALIAPAALSSTGTPLSYNVKFGYNGPFTATPRGLIEPTLTAGTVQDDPDNGSCSLSAKNAQLIPVTIPANTGYARFALYDADVNAGSDMDLCVFNSAGTNVGSSTGATSAEQVNLTNPTAGTYTVVVHGWEVGGSSPFVLNTWLLGTTDAGNMTVTETATATVKGTGTVDVSFNGLQPGKKYVGSVAYGGVSGMPNPTIITVNTPAP